MVCSVRAAQIGLVILWPFVALGFFSILHAPHFADLKPADASGFATFAQNTLPEVSNFGALHVVAPQCSCSEVVIESLLHKDPAPSAQMKESVLVIDDERETAAALRAHGYEVIVMSQNEAKVQLKEAVRGVPLLVIYDSAASLKYVGGYSDAPLTPLSHINFGEFYETYLLQREIKPKRVVGCAVSQEYQALLDPLGIKY